MRITTMSKRPRPAYMTIEGKVDRVKNKLAKIGSKSSFQPSTHSRPTPVSIAIDPQAPKLSSSPFPRHCKLSHQLDREGFNEIKNNYTISGDFTKEPDYMRRRCLVVFKERRRNHGRNFRSQELVLTTEVSSAAASKPLTPMPLDSGGIDTSSSETTTASNFKAKLQSTKFAGLFAPTEELSTTVRTASEYGALDAVFLEHVIGCVRRHTGDCCSLLETIHPLRAAWALLSRYLIEWLSGNTRTVFSLRRLPASRDVASKHGQAGAMALHLVTKPFVNIAEVRGVTVGQSKRRSGGQKKKIVATLACY
ncbi:hypothetical protein K469DRAFT_17592 [Zopfia rhizophila CBS 207.26]|uniref:Uncharacterized protein n=1 Tax=Zopfia rhizophila CBS 207.26 TaxID=1314779 RepID=A0A6A6EUC1_9PEZI|nr:hypothetical protein K469DRAFT_17592 [Zopfia rhizophila CBS 207.26]